MPIEPAPLPYDSSALEPQLSADAVALHRREQQARADAANALLAGNEALAGASLEDLVRTARGALAGHAAQVWNVDFLWASLKPASAGGGGEPAGKLAEAIAARFGSLAGLQEQFSEVAGRLRGAGWVWLVQRADGRLALLATPGSGSPVTGQDTPLLGCSLWEHAWLLDYREDRGRYLAAFWQLVDWKAVAARMK